MIAIAEQCNAWLDLHRCRRRGTCIGDEFDY